MPDIVLSTLNARYAHASFALRYLYANLGELQPRAVIREFEISQRATDIVEILLADQPRIIGLGIYIWNAALSLQVAAELKRVRPEVTLILGGPEISHETQDQELTQIADFVITGEADLAFAQLCDDLLHARPRNEKIIAAQLPDFSKIQLPYDFYDSADIAHRVVYVEASRGCPFSCEFCLSSLDVPVRNVPLEPFLQAMDRLLSRGLKQFKFVDRTFNLNLNFSRSILEFFLERMHPGLFLHFEMIPDRLPDALREIIAKFPPGSLQFEVGIQTFNPDVAARISRRQDVSKLESNLRFLRESTGVHVHADLIVGLPGEDIPSFAQGFDRLLAMGVQEIQVGMLKRLRGTPIARHDREWAMVYSPFPPYEVLSTGAIPFEQMQRLRRFARFWDLLVNSGNFLQTAELLWQGGSAFYEFLKFSDWISQKAGRTHGIALAQLAEWVLEFLVQHRHMDAQSVAHRLWADYQRGGRSDRPTFLLQHIPLQDMKIVRKARQPSPPRRQARRL